MGTVNVPSNFMMDLAAVRRRVDEIARRSVAGPSTVILPDPATQPEVSAYAAVAVDTVLGAGHSVVLVDSTAATRTITLPTAVGIAGRAYLVKKQVAANLVTIATTSSQTIDGVTTWNLAAAGDYLKVVSDGANWQIIAGKVQHVYSAPSTANLTTTSAPVDMTGATVTFRTSPAVAVIDVEAKWDMDQTVTGTGLVIGTINVDGTDVDNTFINGPTVNWRQSGFGLYSTTLAPGSHTVKLRGSKQFAAGTSTIYAGSRLTVRVFE